MLKKWFKHDSQQKDYHSINQQNLLLMGGGLLFCIILAFSLRWYFHIVIGGNKQYLAWSMQHFFGEIAKQNLYWSDLLLQHRGLPQQATSEGYAIFIALLRIAGVSSLEQLRIAQGFIDALAILPLYWLLRCLHIRPSIALFVGLIYAVFPSFAIGSTLIYPDCMAPALYILVLCCLAYTQQQKNYFITAVVALLGGLVIGIGTLFSNYFLLFLIPYLGWILFTNKRYAMIIAIISLFVGIIIIFAAWQSYLDSVPIGKTTTIMIKGKRVRKQSTAEEDFHVIKFNRTYAKNYWQNWRKQPIKMTTTILQRWGLLIFSSARIPGYTSYFVTLSYLLRYFGIFILLLVAYLFRKKYANVLLISLPFLFGLLVNIYTPTTHLYTGTVVLSYLLACGLLAQWCDQYINVHPTKYNQYIFTFLGAIIIAYVALELIEIIINAWEVLL